MPPGAAAPTPPAPVGWSLTGCGRGAALVCKFMAARWGDHWLLSDEERDEFAPALKSVLDKWLPPGERGPEVELLLAVLVVFGPRALATDWGKYKREKQAPDHTAGTGPAGPAPAPPNSPRPTPENSKTAGFGASPASSASAGVVNQPSWAGFFDNRPAS